MLKSYIKKAYCLLLTNLEELVPRSDILCAIGEALARNVLGRQLIKPLPTCMTLRFLSSEWHRRPAIMPCVLALPPASCCREKHRNKRLRAIDKEREESRRAEEKCLRRQFEACR